MLLQLFGNFTVCVVILADDDGTGGIFIDAVYDSGTQDAIDAAQILSAVIQDCVHERSAPVPGSRMYDHSLGFVDDKNIAVLIKNIDRNIFRFDVRNNFIRKREINLIALRHAQAVSCRPAVQLHIPVLYKFLQIRS